MKNGQPSRIVGIRYFHPTAYEYLEGHQEAVAYGRRLALLLNGEGLSLGAYHSLYLAFSPTHADGSIQVTDQGGDWWQRYTYIGVPRAFPDMPDAGELIMQGTVSALKTIRPDCAQMIDDADSLVRQHGSDLRFLLKTKQTKRHTVDVSFDISDWPAPSHFHVSVTDRSNGEVLDATPVPLKFYDEAHDLAGSVTLKDDVITVAAHRSFSAGFTGSHYSWPFTVKLDELVPATPHPVFSKQIHPRG